MLIRRNYFHFPLSSGSRRLRLQNDSHILRWNWWDNPNYILWKPFNDGHKIYLSALLLLGDLSIYSWEIVKYIHVFEFRLVVCWNGLCWLDDLKISTEISFILLFITSSPTPAPVYRLTSILYVCTISWIWCESAVCTISVAASEVRLDHKQHSFFIATRISQKVNRLHLISQLGVVGIIDIHTTPRPRRMSRGQASERGICWLSEWKSRNVSIFLFYFDFTCVFSFCVVLFVDESPEKKEISNVFHSTQCQMCLINAEFCVPGPRQVSSLSILICVCCFGCSMLFWTSRNKFYFSTSLRSPCHFALARSFTIFFSLAIRRVSLESNIFHSGASSVKCKHLSSGSHARNDYEFHRKLF